MIAHIIKPFSCLVIAGLVLLSCSNDPVHSPVPEEKPQAPKPSEASAQYWGYVEINRRIKTAIIKEGEEFDLGMLLGAPYSDFGNNLLDLLGTYKGNGYGSEFRNGKPNSLNMLLWYLLFKQFSEKLAASCDDASALTLNEAFREVHQALCAWPNVTDADTALAKYWLMVMGFEAPLEEMAKWQDFILSPEAQTWSRQQAIENLNLAIFMNPYYLLRN
ncbi:MAG: hypothetical protein H6624_08975 [Bdellovibrionaceae bacterium]|nr:hypothetical protein [Bdellovibrionales bacterium]MCB9084466.1 hypothetical protein [Pseudobdellovibrionaceae bacterium]